MRKRTSSIQTGRPKVAIVSDAIHPYHRGGKELRYFELMKRLTSYADVDMYTMRWWTGPSTCVQDGMRLHAISPLIPLYSNQRRSLTQALRFGLACFRMLKYDFDVLEADHIPFFQVLILGLVTTIKRKPFVATWHEVWGRTHWRQYLGPLGVVAWFVEELAMRAPDHIIAVSEQTAERLRESLGDRAAITVAPNGIDLDAVASAYPDAAPTDLVVVGRLMIHKRVDMLLEAVAALHADGLPVTCRVIGNGPEEEELHRKADQLGISRAVDFRHDVSEQKDVYSLLKAARACVFPSEREGFGIAVIEALACGVPVITTSAPDNLARHLVERSIRGTVCDSSVEALASALRAILDGRGPETGRPEAWLTEYSWEATTGKVAWALGLTPELIGQPPFDAQSPGLPA
jgi:glycosyltransferase involved in cell wall biosynthesis